jgi:hypothetical protein
MVDFPGYASNIFLNISIKLLLSFFLAHSPSASSAQPLSAVGPVSKLQSLTYRFQSWSNCHG